MMEWFQNKNFTQFSQRSQVDLHKYDHLKLHNNNINKSQQIMGGNLCGNTHTQGKSSRLQIKFGEDPKEMQIDHPRTMKFTDEHLEKQLGGICEDLYKNRTMYLDPTMQIDPILIKKEKDQIKCTFERTYHFMHAYQKGSSPLIVDPNMNQPQFIEVKDEIMQYFGVFLCFLADKPKLIQQIIQTDSNSFGIHCVAAYINGIRKDIVIDDYFLCHNDEPIFSQPCQNKYIWPLILEKAWLKIRGSLDHRVQQGSPEDIFDTFLRFPIEKINLEGENKEVVSEKIRTNISQLQKEKGYILTSKKDPEHKLGISGRKNFYLIGTFEHNNKQLFYIRNPYFEKFTFRGYYSNLDDFDELKEILIKKYIRIDPGNFCLDVEEFSQQFSQVSIVHFIWGNKIEYMPFKAEDKEEFFIGAQLYEKGGDLTFNVQQFSDEPIKDEVFYPLTYQVIKLPEKRIIGGLDNSEGCFGAQNTTLIDKIILPNASGKYLIRLKKKDFKKKAPNSKIFLVGSYRSSLKFHIANQQQLQEEWKAFLKSEGQKSLGEKKIKLRKKEDCVHTICWLGDIALVYVKKINEKKESVKVEVNFSELQNLECISHSEIRKSDEYKVLILKDQLLIIFEKIDLTAETHINKYHLEPF